jgi:hypothetical protein
MTASDVFVEIEDMKSGVYLTECEKGVEAV